MTKRDSVEEGLCCGRCRLSPVIPRSSRAGRSGWAMADACNILAKRGSDSQRIFGGPILVHCALYRTGTHSYHITHACLLCSP